MIEWKPIETAPKDGKVVIVICDDVPMLAGWSFRRRTTKETVRQRSAWWRPPTETITETSTDISGWFQVYAESNGDGFEYHVMGCGIEPTHWCDLPTPPEGDQP